MASCKCVAPLLLLLLPALIGGFPDGAPVDACVKDRPNQPYHGQARSRPEGSSPYKITASDSHYGPGTKITVTIEGSTFRGFFMQARDDTTGDWVGEWETTPNTSGLPECSAITHGDNKDKLQATLVWVAPQDTRGGRVYFTGAVVKDYSTFWVNLIADSP